MPVNIEDIIGKPAIFQILSKKRGRTEEEKTQLAMKIETSCKRFNNNNGRLSIDEFYNVIKLQNGVEVSKDEIRRLVADLDMDKDFKISIKVVVVKQLVREKYTHWTTSSLFQEFMTEPIISEFVFMEMDKNKDGYISKSELRLAQRKLSLDDLNKFMIEADKNQDGKLTFEEVKQIALQQREAAQNNKKWSIITEWF